MGGDSRRSFRIKGLRDDLTEQNFLRVISKLNSKLPDRYCHCKPHVSLAVYDMTGAGLTKQCGTVSCRSRYHKYSLIEKASQSRSLDSGAALFSVTFEGMTVLHTPINPEAAEIDICVVHGLNGHAIDTFEDRSSHRSNPRKPWRMRLDDTTHRIRNIGQMLFRHDRGIEDPNPTNPKAIGDDSIASEDSEEENVQRFTKDPRSMWPRDFLAKDDIFTKSRIMTFDYNAKFDDARDLGKLSDWSIALLRELNSLRSKCHSERPIIFIGYSMGGIVIRQAAADLWKNRSTKQNPNVPLNQCGFMFLGTPHYGSHLAETGKLANIVLALFGRRKEMLAPLQGEPHNKCIREHQDAWTDFFSTIEVGRRPIVCFSEARESRILHGFAHAVIVKQQNARWMDVNAEEIGKTDHHTICAYSSANDSGYEIIVRRLREIRKELLPLGSSEYTADAPVYPRGARQASQEESIVSGSLPERGSSPTAQPSGLLLDHHDFGEGVLKSLVCSERSLWHGETDSLPRTQCGFEKTKSSDGGLDPRSPLSKSTITIIQVQAQTESVPLCLPETIARSPGKDMRGSSDMHVPMHGDATQHIQLRMIGKDTSLRDSVLQISRPTSPRPDETDVTERSLSAGVVNAWREQSSLSLDGGGLRGYSALLLLKMLMVRISEIEHETDDYVEDYLPCHYFDYVTGIGTGGIVAIMLGRLRMSVEDCVLSYRSLAKKSFEMPHHTLNTDRLRVFNRGNDLEDVIKNILPVSTNLKLKASPDRCKTSVIAYEPYEKRCRVLRNYDNRSVSQPMKPLPQFRPLSPERADGCRVAEAMCAISAAPPYSKPFAILGNKYMDASGVLANPSRELINEVLNRPGNKPTTLKCLVSMGCGKPNHEYYGNFQQLNAKNALKAMALDSQNAHEQTDTFSRLHKTPYFRFEVKGRIWKRPRTSSGDQALHVQLEKEVRDYFDTEEVRQLLEDCAKNLVTRRRLRAQDRNRWDRFTSAKL